MLKQLFILLFNLISYPEKTWKALNEKQEYDNEYFQKSYLYPVFGIIALFSFAGVLFYLKDWDVKVGDILQTTLKIVIKETLTYFAGFFLAAFVLSRLSLQLFEKEIKNPLSQRFIGYASAAVYAVAMIYTLLPSLIFIQLFVVYTFYIVWQGAIHYMEIKEKYLTKFTIFASILILLSLIIVRLLLTLMMPGLSKVVL